MEIEDTDSEIDVSLVLELEETLELLVFPSLLQAAKANALVHRSIASSVFIFIILSVSNLDTIFLFVALQL